MANLNSFSLSRATDSSSNMATAAGRFGVGFNSCYHLSDVVSFVSGRHLVIFDPHCTALPGVSATDPGKRIDFVASRVADANPDQFSPYQVGVNLASLTSCAELAVVRALQLAKASCSQATLRICSAWRTSSDLVG